MARPKAWYMDEVANRIVIEWQDGHKGSIPANDIHVAAFVKTYMIPIPQLTLHEHLDMICK